MSRIALHELLGRRLKGAGLAAVLLVFACLLALTATPAQASPDETTGSSAEETKTAAALKTYLEGNPSRPPGGDTIQKQELSAAAVQPEWQIGPASSSYYIDPITNLLSKYTMDWVGYWGTSDMSYPRVGDLYYGAVVVGNASPNLPAYPIIDIKLPRDTSFDINSSDSARKIRCYLHDSGTGAIQELTGSKCPTQPSQGIHGWNFNPPDVVELAPGYMIEIQFPLRSSKTLQGISDPTGGSCLVGAITVGFHDDVPEAGEICPLADNDGAYQGVFVSEALDTTPPNTTITSGPSGAVKSTSASFGFSSSEASSTFQCSFDGAAFTTCASPKGYTNLNNGSHTFKVRAIDAAGNVDATPAIRAWTVDTTAPAGSVKINGGAAYTKSPSVTLSLSATDPSPTSGVTSMRFSNDGANWSAWQGYATSKSWTLAGGNGTRTVYVQYRDKAGNISTAARDAIKLDTAKPTISGMSPRHGSFTKDRTPTIKATVKDNMTNLAKGNIRLYVAGKAIPASKYSYSAATDQLVYNSPRLSKGKKTVRIVATDSAKNVGARSWYFTIR